VAEQAPIDLKRVLDKVQSDSTGALLVQSAVQACVIEDQATVIEGLRAELVRATSGADRSSAGKTGAGEPDAGES
jgi:hypothetical protein